MTRARLAVLAGVSLAVALLIAGFLFSADTVEPIEQRADEGTQIAASAQPRAPEPVATEAPPTAAVVPSIPLEAPHGANATDVRLALNAGSQVLVTETNAPIPKRDAATSLPDAGMRYALTRDGIRAAVQEGIPGIRECYEEWIKVQPTLGGRVSVRFRIGTDDAGEGKVQGISLGDAGLGHFAMEGCILSAFDELRFEAPENGTMDVTYPITLSHDGGR